MNKPRRPKRLIFQKIVTIITITAYLPAIAGWYISSDNWWPLGLASIGFAYLWLILLLIAGWWWHKGQRLIAALCITLMIAGFQPAKATFSIGWDKDYLAKKDQSALRVMQWNCMELPGNHKGWIYYTEERKALETFVLQYNPDIICIQDFGEHIGVKLQSNFAFLQDTLGYPYKIFAESSNMFRVFGQTIIGTAIFSKQPFLKSGSLPFTNRPFPEYIVWADVLLQGKPVRMVTTHFRSMNLSAPKASEGGKLPYYLQDDTTILKETNPFVKVKFYQSEHVLQAKQLRAFMDSSQVPVVLCSDMNTVPASATYRIAKGNLTDGFIGSKTGLGNTYNFLLPNLRIDYILHHPSLEAKQWKHFSNGFFDHDHLMADLAWKIK
jgi:endonuclease/exonuclease/phosphatase family metal-dependent hydrolase